MVRFISTFRMQVVSWYDTYVILYLSHKIYEFNYLNHIIRWRGQRLGENGEHETDWSCHHPKHLKVGIMRKWQEQQWTQRRPKSLGTNSEYK